MDVQTKTSARSHRDNFLADAVKPRTKHVSYGDGFRFGIGLITAHLLVVLLVGGIAWALIAGLKLHF